MAEKDAEKDIVRTTCPRDCYDSCGIAVVRRDGQVAKVLGDREHPTSRGTLCGKCAIAYNGAWRDPEARLTRPLRRSGAKGSGQFEPVTWDEALADVAERVAAAVEHAGPQSVLQAHYTGTCSLIAGDFPLRFFNRLGATEVEPDTICNNAGHVALDYLYGSSVSPFDPKTAKDSRCILVWGANPSSSAPHAHKNWLGKFGGTVIAVDPVRHPTAERADLHLQPFPGTDAALAFAMLHVLARDELLDLDFIAAHTLGWDEVAPLIAGCPPDWGQEITGVAAADIEEAARIYGEGPSVLWLGQGLQRQRLGGNIFRACSLLPAASGNLGKPGAGLYYLNGSGPRRIDGDYVAAPHLRNGAAASISHMDLVEALADAEGTRVFFNWNMNVAASGPRQDALRRALARESLFTVVVDLFMTDTAALADLVLPAASFLEFDDLVTPYFHLLLSAQAAATAPPGEALPNQEIFRRLARAMGYEEPELFESDRSILDTVLEKSGLGITFDELKQEGTIDPFDEALVQFQDLTFPTPSGRIEIASARAEADGHPRVPQPSHDPRPPRGRWRLLSPASRWQMNDSYANDPTIAKKLGPAAVTLHPDDASQLGVAAGDLVRLANELGEMTLEAAISDHVPRGAALSHKGRWPGLEAQGCNVNRLNSGDKSDMGESSSVHGTLVEIRCVDA
jgi:anaerobic selenocysteine-containing dehydrogenase